MSFRVIRELLGDLPNDKSPGWELVVNGIAKLADLPRSLELVSKFGVFRWGWNGKYDTWGFEEAGGGGSVLVPFFQNEHGVPFVGVVMQMRPFQSEEPVWNVPRGFLDPGATHFESAKTEASEELGVQNADRIFELAGEPGNPNSTFFVTRGLQENGEAKGIRFWGVRFSESEMVAEGENTFALREGVVSPVTDEAERIMGCKFIPASSVVKLGCLISCAGAGRLVGMVG
jgi:hypothetical protein